MYIFLSVFLDVHAWISALSYATERAKRLEDHIILTWGESTCSSVSPRPQAPLVEQRQLICRRSGIDCRIQGSLRALLSDIARPSGSSTEEIGSS